MNTLTTICKYAHNNFVGWMGTRTQTLQLQFLTFPWALRCIIYHSHYLTFPIMCNLPLRLKPDDQIQIVVTSYSWLTLLKVDHSVTFITVTEFILNVCMCQCLHVQACVYKVACTLAMHHCFVSPVMRLWVLFSWPWKEWQAECYTSCCYTELDMLFPHCKDLILCRMYT